MQKKEDKNLKTGKKYVNVSRYCLITGMKNLDVYKLIREEKLKARKINGLINISVII